MTTRGSSAGCGPPSAPSRSSAYALRRLVAGTGLCSRPDTVECEEGGMKMNAPAPWAQPTPTPDQWGQPPSCRLRRRPHATMETRHRRHLLRCRRHVPRRHDRVGGHGDQRNGRDGDYNRRDVARPVLRDLVRVLGVQASLADRGDRARYGPHPRSAALPRGRPWETRSSVTRNGWRKGSWGGVGGCRSADETLGLR